MSPAVKRWISPETFFALMLGACGALMAMGADRKTIQETSVKATVHDSRLTILEVAMARQETKWEAVKESLNRIEKQLEKRP
jgi:hypothetical protein